MAISLHTNYANLVTQHTLNSTNNALSTSMERLSTGFRINSASDDAAGLQIANRLEAQSRGMNVAMRNSQDAISMMQTAEGAMDEMTNIAYRMNDLATQAANGSNSAEDQAALQSEFQALGDQLNDMQGSTKFGGQALLGGGTFGAGAVSFQTGAGSDEKLEVNVSAEVSAIATDASKFGASGSLNISTAANAQAAMDALTGDPADATDSGFVGTLGEARSAFGAQINNLEHNITNLANMVENVEASKGRIMDTDFAAESGEMSKNQMLMQSGAQMLSATKSLPQLAMSMLG
ncbi:lateral flagellin LafA [Vibrio algivorus]|uniref:Flagellin n=1 Tax=Vibrio algivorus TaxID=1667024 RepID=A0A557NV37_9VIBR|nr:lateral flagellin LafA [Vibrio algivorus]TVO32284.1 Lateral flagellin [Vibrio algivorus]